LVQVNTGHIESLFLSTGKTEIEKERDNESYRVRKLEKIIEKCKLQNQDLRHEVTNLKAQLLGSSEIKVGTFVTLIFKAELSTKKRMKFVVVPSLPWNKLILSNFSEILCDNS